MSDPIEDAAAAALAGELVVLPTDTVYGIGTRPDEPAATSRLFEAKGRPRSLELPILVASVAEARGVGEFDERAERLAGRLWPGGLTMVLRRTEASRTWDLGEDVATVALRIPHHPMALAVLSRTGPLAVTSANRTGEPTPESCEELEAIFGDRVSVYLCEDRPLAGRPSTVIDLTGPELRVLRSGTIDEPAIRSALED